MAYSLIWLPEVLRAAGLKVAEQPGWASRGKGDIKKVRGIICHHTAGGPTGNMPSLNVITFGRPGLSGPLAQLGLGRDGTFYVVAAGRANHAGAGAWCECSTGNSSFIGIEAEHTGKDSDPWPTVQLDAYRRGVAAILKKLGVDAEWCCGHKEYAQPAGRKPDPCFDMVEFRKAVTTILTGEAPAPVLIPANDAKARKTLRRGDRGPLVKEIQPSFGCTADGVFGPATEQAARQFQRERNMVPDGIVGPKTWAAIDAAIASKPKPAPVAPPQPTPAPAPTPVS